MGLQRLAFCIFAESINEYMFQTIILSFLQSFLELILDVLYFPVWWYSIGLKNTGVWAIRKIIQGEKVLGLKIWVVNLFHPMYGVRDWQGKIISFFMRLIQIIFRSILMVGWIGVILILSLAWVVVPVFVVYQIIRL